VSILSAHGVRIEDISDLVGHSGTTVTESVYQHELRPALTTGATAMNKILSNKRARSAQPVTNRHEETPTRVAPRLAPEDQKGILDQDPKPLLTC
jgi:hypothetical protein